MKTTNYITNLLELSNKSCKLKSKPQFLQIFITTNCNLKCIMCCNGFENRDKYLAYEVIAEILKDNQQLTAVEWIGGEPLMHPDFEKLLDLAHNLRIKQILVTNGLLLNKRLIKKLIEYKVDLTISIHAPRKQVYEKIQQGSNFEKLLKNIKTLTDFKQKKAPELLTVNYVVLKQNYQYLGEMIKFLTKYGIKNIFFESDIANGADSVLNDGKIKKLLPDILKKIKENALKNKINVCVDDKFIQPEPVKKLKISKDEFYCLVPWISSCIEVNGDVKNSIFCGVKTGNIFKNSFNKIWNSKKSIQIRKNMSAKKMNLSKECGKCADMHVITKMYRALDRFTKVLIRNY